MIINVVTAADDNFSQHAAAMIASILLNKSKEDLIVIYLLSLKISGENIDRIKRVVELNNGKFHLINADESIFRNFPMPDNKSLKHISIATYIRIFIPNLLPSSVKKVIYLDGDIIVRASLRPLYEFDIKDNAISAVLQMTEWTVSDCDRLGYDAKYGYFNAGVMLLNLDYWRENNISDILEKYIINNSEKIIYHDQDALNANLYNKKMPLPCEWNMMNIFFRRGVFKIKDIVNGELKNNYNEYKGQLKNAQKNPSIVHFVSKPKPWDAKCTHPYRSEYYKYLRFTFWGFYTEPNFFLGNLYRLCRKLYVTVFSRDLDYVNFKKY